MYVQCFVAVVLLGRLPAFSTPRFFFFFSELAVDGLRSTKSSCFAPILTIKVGFPPKYLEKIHLGHAYYYFGFREKAPFIPNPFDTLIYFCVF